MQITILGGGGFLGRKIAARLAADGDTRRPAGHRPDAVRSAPSRRRRDAPFPVTALAGDIVDAARRPRSRPAPTSCSISPPWSARRRRRTTTSAAGSICAAPMRWSTPAAVSSTPGASRRAWCSPVRSPASAAARTPILADDARQIPGNSYGAQKAAAELILADASRRGFLDAVSIRLPTVIVRPGRPNKAASSFFSAIVREPLLGLATELPVPDDFAAWVCSPRRAVDWLLHAAAHGHQPPWASTAASTRPASARRSRICCRRWTRCSPAPRALVRARRGPGDRGHRRHLAAARSSRCAPARSASPRTSRSSS